MIIPLRDQVVAETSVHAAVVNGLKPAIAVDDDACLEAMVLRVTIELDRRGLRHDTKRSPGAATIAIEGGTAWIAVVAVDQIADFNWGADRGQA